MRPRLTGDGVRSLLASLPSERTTLVALTARARVDVDPGLTQLAVARAVRRSIDSGDVAIHDDPAAEETAIVLTPLGAYRQGVILSDDSSVWMTPEEFEKGMSRRRVPAELLDENGDVWRIPDRRVPMPIDRLISFEDDIDVPSTSLIILGLQTPLPLPTTPFPPLACPLHRGRLPSPGRYCLYCDSISRPTPRPKIPVAVRLPRERMTNV